MTNAMNIAKKRDLNFIVPIVSLTFIILAFVFHRELKSGIINGMNLAALKIIPTLFPFMIISDYWISNINPGRNTLFGILFEKAFKINRCSAQSMLTGAFAGFPLGAKSAVDTYRTGAISIDELQRLLPIVNLPSFAFVISGVGLGLYGEIKIGVLLYFSVLLSAITFGIISGAGKKHSLNSTFIPGQSFDLTLSIKKAGLSSITVSSYIIFFSGVIGLVSSLIKSDALCAIISSFLEVGNATSIISSNKLFTKEISLILTSFALGFSGFSVHFQAFSFLPSEISRKKYLLSKLLIGTLSSFFMCIYIIVKELH